MPRRHQQTDLDLVRRLPYGFAALLIGLMTALWNTQARAQPAREETNAEYEAETVNPVTHFYTMPLRYKASFEDGFYNATASYFQLNNAVTPFRLDEDWFLIARSSGSYVLQPPKKQGESWGDGFNNFQTTLFLSPARGDRFFWGAGPVISLPTATNTATGQNKWALGPSFAFVWRGSDEWTIGLVTNNVWSGGTPQGNDTTNSFLLNPIASYRFGDGWSLGTSPNITSNWASKSDKRWTVPLGGALGKAFKIGSQPMSIKYESYYNVIRPGDHASIWGAQLTLTLLFGR